MAEPNGTLVFCLLSILFNFHQLMDNDTSVHAIWSDSYPKRYRKRSHHKRSELSQGQTRVFPNFFLKKKQIIFLSSLPLTSRSLSLLARHCLSLFLPLSSLTPLSLYLDPILPFPFSPPNGQSRSPSLANHGAASAGATRWEDPEGSRWRAGGFPVVAAKGGGRTWPRGSK